MFDFRLKVFVSVANNLSFTKAAQELFVSQPAITKHIRELEMQYEVRLFDRFGNKISLTDAGQVLLKYSQHILEEYAKMDYEMHLLRNVYTGELRIGASTSIAQYVLPAFLAKFTEKFPHVAVSLFSDNSIGIEKALQEHNIDLGLVEGNSRQINLKYTKFMDDELVAVVHTKSSLAAYDELSVEQLKSIPLVLREHGSGTLEVIKSALAGHGIKLSDMQVKMYLGSTESIKHFLENTDCMGIVSIRSISRELYGGLFKVVEIKDLEMNREFDFVQLQGQDAGLQQQFIQFAEYYKNNL